MAEAIQNVLAEHRDGIARITIHRPEKKNALTRAMYDRLTDELASAAETTNIRVVVIAGHDDVFTAGNDLLDFMQDPPSSEDTPVMRFLRAIVGFEKPIVAAVDGPAIGIGTTMLLHCDLVYASERARFRLPFVELGLCPEAASSFLLPRLMGHARAAEMLLLGETLDAGTARELGLVTAVIPSDRLAAHVEDRAMALAAQPPGAVLVTKRLTRAPLRTFIEEALLAEGREFMARLRSPEAGAAFQAFFARKSGR